MSFVRGAAICSANFALLEILCMFKPAYPWGKFKTSDSGILSALEERYVLKVAYYSYHILRSWVIN